MLAAALSCAPASHAIVTEVYYDAPGDDTGHEFVELWNPGPGTALLNGVRLEGGDGGAPGRWTLRWVGGPGDSLKAGQRFVVGGALLTPPPQRTVNLELQNGPDAVRLVWPDGLAEIVGWGTHEYTEYFCGEPATDVSAGSSLARVPDAAATGSNAGDFRAATPSPGVANVRTVDAALARGRLVLEPAQPSPGGNATLSVSLVNAGVTAWGLDDASLRVNSGLLGMPVSVVAPALAPGETLLVHVPLASLIEGRGALAVRVALVGDESPTNDADTLLVRVGPGPLEVTEIQFHPAAGEGEWIEVRNRSREALPLEAFRLGDRSGATGRVDAGAALAPESLAVLAQDPVALLLAYPKLDPARVRRAAPWSALNNSDDARCGRRGHTGRSRRCAGAAGDVFRRRRSLGRHAGVCGRKLAALPDAGGHATRAAARVAAHTRRVPGRSAARGRGRRDGEVRLGAAVAQRPRHARLYDPRVTAPGLAPVELASAWERPVTLEALPPGIYLAVLRAESSEGTFTRVTPLRVEGIAR
jgi:hypothetical protein